MIKKIFIMEQETITLDDMASVTGSTAPRFLNLSIPIFVLYINTYGISRAKAEMITKELMSQFKFNNANLWVIPINEKNGNGTRIECIYNPIAQVFPMPQDLMQKVLQ